jgi:enoyl-CoA hydratase
MFLRLVPTTVSALSTPRRWMSSTAPSNLSLLQKWLQPRGATPKLDDLHFKTLSLTPSLGDDDAAAGSPSDSQVLNVRLSRPKKMNAFNMTMWNELDQLFSAIEHTPSIRAVVIRGDGRCFSSGMDLNVFASMKELLGGISCEGRKREMLSHVISRFQRVISAPERCRVPVIAAVHGQCWGGAVDFITSCDLRICDDSAEFSIKEIDLAIVADIGTLQRLPVLVGEQVSKEWAYTGRLFYGPEAVATGLVLKSHADSKALFAHAAAVAQSIATKSPLTIRGIKKAIHYQRDHSTADALDQVQMWNSSMLYSNDLNAAMSAMVSKTVPTFQD